MTTLRRRIFVVEDEALIAMELRDHLQELGYEVCGHAARGEAALRMIPDAAPDLILLDINLGNGMSGLEVAEHLQRTSDVPIVFLTAYADAALTERAALTGSFGYLVKPYQPAALQANIEMALYKQMTERKLLATSRQLDAAVSALRLQNSELRRSHALRRAAFDATADGLLVLGGYERANSRFFEMWRVPPEIAELGGETLITWLMSQVVDPSKLLPHATGLGADIEVDAAVELRDGRVFERYVRPQLLDGEVVGHVLSFRDVTGPRRAAAELRASEEQFHDLFEFAPDAVLMIAEDGSIVLANRKAESLLGYSRSELLGMSVEALVPMSQRRAHPRHRRDFLVDAAPRQMGSRKRLMHAVHRDGTQIPVDISLGPLRSAAGSLVVAAIRDVSEWVKIEGQQRSLEHQLRHSQKLEALGTLAGGIAHDFNNLLAVIHSGVELARADIDPAGAPARHLDAVATATDRGTLLVRQILAFSRRQPTRRVVTDLGPVVEEVAQLLRVTLPAAIQLEVEIGPDLPHVLVDVTQIHQVLMNLGTNAWHAIGEGPGRIHIRVESPATPAACVARVARIIVRDDGKGMDHGTLERVFEPFFTTKEVGQGSGLGLSVVHGIIQEHGGAITVESQPKCGATFVIELPAAEGRAIELPRVSDLPIRGQGHVLYLDDEDLLVTLGEALLRRIGYSVSAFSSVRDALLALHADPHRFDAVVTDTHMPGMSGIDLAQEIGRLRPELPVVLVSGRSERSHAELAALGIRHHLDKPFGARELADVLHRAITDRAVPARAMHPHDQS
jgi:PAS domain S-box-containing protein